MRVARCVLLCSVVFLSACDPDEGRLTLRDVDRYSPALLQEALEPSWNNGRINHEVLRGHYRESLELFARLLEGHGPRTRPSLFRFPRQKLAFYTNAHNGLALLSWLRAGSADGDAERRWDPAWSQREFAIDGELLSLDDLTGRVRAEGEKLPFGSGRSAELLLSRGRRQDPGFAATPYDGQLYEGESGAQLRFLLNAEGAFTGTSGAVVGPAWLRTLTHPAPEDPDAPPPLPDTRLADFLAENLGLDHPLRLEILRAAREGRLEPGAPDERIAPAFH